MVDCSRGYEYELESMQILLSYSICVMKWLCCLILSGSKFSSKRLQVPDSLRFGCGYEGTSHQAQGLANQPDQAVTVVGRSSDHEDFFGLPAKPSQCHTVHFTSIADINNLKSLSVDYFEARFLIYLITLFNCISYVMWNDRINYKSELKVCGSGRGLPI
jgi:hypothetical protein